MIRNLFQWQKNLFAHARRFINSFIITCGGDWLSCHNSNFNVDFQRESKLLSLIFIINNWSLMRLTAALKLLRTLKMPLKFSFFSGVSESSLKKFTKPKCSKMMTMKTTMLQFKEKHFIAMLLSNWATLRFLWWSEKNAAKNLMNEWREKTTKCVFDLKKVNQHLVKLLEASI